MIAGCEDLSRVSPIHTREVYGTGFAVPNKQPETVAQELNEFLSRHLACGHLKLSMVNRSVPADMAVNGHVIGWIDKYRICFTPAHQLHVGIFLKRATAEYSVFSK
jgi:hypothetical protein